MPGGPHPPLAVILSWPAPNYVNPESQGNALVVVSLLLASLATVLVVLRISTRVWIIRHPGVDDFFVVLGLTSAYLATTLAIISQRTYGVGYHIWDVPISKAAGGRFVVWLSLFAIVLSQGFTKISILVFYGRLAAGSYAKLFIWGVRVGILYNVTSSIAFTLTIIFTCRPINAYWNQFALGYHGEYSCLNEQIALPLSSVFSVLGDLYATLLPLLLLKGLQLPRRQKWMIYSLFSLGFFVVAAGTVRTVYLYQLMDESYDITWIISTEYLWTFVETYGAIMCASVPALRPLFVRYLSSAAQRPSDIYVQTSAYTNVDSASHPSMNPGRNRNPRSSGAQSMRTDPTTSIRNTPPLEPMGDEDVEMQAVTKNDGEQVGEEIGSKSSGDLAGGVCRA